MATRHMLRWAVYLACSWTWCIGMFLPVLLMRDYGIWGFIVFAAPNVVGAAGFGWVLARPGASEALVARHGRAMAIFSEVTIAFQAFFLIYLLSMFDGVDAVVLMAGWMAPLILVSRIVGLITRISPAKRFGLDVILLSLAMFAVSSNLGDLDPTAFAAAGAGAPDPALLWLAPVCVFGFMLCPYLDLTFHRARQECPGREGTAAFTFGFGVIFLVMILLTLGYGSLFAGGFEGWAWKALLLTAMPIGVHMISQMLFTCVEHFACMAGVTSNRFLAPPLQLREKIRRRDIPWVIAAVATPLAFVALYFLLSTDATYKGLALGEVGYRCFMGFYGLAFPAYVWLLMLPTRDGHAGPQGPLGRRKLRVLWLTIGFATPMFWMGFVEGSEVWLGPGVLVVLLARLALPRATTPSGQHA